MLRVSDAGPGFAPAMLSHFGKPYQSSKGRPGGGLGLFLALNVARQLGGSMVARNREPSGAVGTMSLPLAARLGKRLLELAQVYGVEREEGRLIDLPLPQDDLANMLGATRQSVSKQLKAWEQRGWIALRYRHVAIRDSGALERAVARWSQGAAD